MGGIFSFCYNSNSDDPSRTPLKSQKFTDELSLLNHAHADAKSNLGGSAKAAAYARALVGTPDGVFSIGLANKRQHMQSALLTLDQALASEGLRGMRGNERVVELFYWKGEVLWWGGDRRAAVKELREGLKVNIAPMLLDSLCLKLKAVGQADDGLPKVLRVVSPKAATDDERRLLISAFYEHTTLGYRAMYAWLPERLVDEWVEAHGNEHRQGNERDKDTSFLERKMTLQSMKSKEALLSPPPKLRVPGEVTDEEEQGKILKDEEKEEKTEEKEKEENSD